MAVWDRLGWSGDYIERNLCCDNRFAFLTRHVRKNAALAINDLGPTEVVRRIGVALVRPGLPDKISCMRRVNHGSFGHSNW
jgi:hypothetical protein